MIRCVQRPAVRGSCQLDPVVRGENISKSWAAPELWTPVGKEVKQALTGAIVACSQLRPFLRSGHQPAPGLVVLGECPAAALSM